MISRVLDRRSSNRHDCGQSAVPSSAADESRCDGVYDATHVKEVKESAERVEMAVIAVNSEIALHQID
jgi:hypothetical protein